MCFGAGIPLYTPHGSMYCSDIFLTPNFSSLRHFYLLISLIPFWNLSVPCLIAMPRSEYDILRD